MERRRNLPIRSVAIEDLHITFEAFADDGNRLSSLYQLAFLTPLLASPLLNLSLSAFSLDRDNTAFAAHRERSEGARAKISVSAYNAF
jgi:outer membrane protein insertion porin family